MSALCGSCKAPITWARTEAGKPIPIDMKTADPTKANIRLVHVYGAAPMAYVVEPGRGTHVSHFATCPDADAHRKPKAQGTLL